MSNFGFKCPEDGCRNRLHIYILTPMCARPLCFKHQTEYVPDISWPEGTKIEDATIYPAEADEILSNVFRASLAAVDEPTVNMYATLMREGRWKACTVEMGGAHHPILFRNNRLLLGVQRLLACKQANVPFTTVKVYTH